MDGMGKLFEGNFGSRLASVLATSIVAFGSWASVSSAAEVTFEPQSPRTSGDALYWSFKSSESASGPYGWTAYKLNDEPWTRCFPGSSLTKDIATEGRHELLVADDINLNNWNSRGLGSSSFTQPCYMADPPAPPGPYTRSEVVIDRSPPLLPEPEVYAVGLEVVFSAYPTDLYSQVNSIIWNFGDGTGDYSNQQFVLHTYPSSGTFNGSVTARDELGHATETPFSITVKDPTDANPEPEKPGEGENQLQVRISSLKVKRRAKKVVVRFRSNSEGSSFRCGLAGRRLRTCRSPATIKLPKPGRSYQVVIRATSPEGKSTLAKRWVWS
jgi:hypothetical protein